VGFKHAFYYIFLAKEAKKDAVLIVNPKKIDKIYIFFCKNLITDLNTLKI
jgi:hypothetical protein